MLASAWAKAGEVPEAIRKGVEDAKKHLIAVPLPGTTIPFPRTGRFAASEVTAEARGRLVLASSPVALCARWWRPLASATSSRSRWAARPRSIPCMATMDGLRALASFESEAARRGRTVAELVGPRRAQQIAEAAAVAASYTPPAREEREERGGDPSRVAVVARGPVGGRGQAVRWWPVVVLADPGRGGVLVRGGLVATRRGGPACASGGPSAASPVRGTRSRLISWRILAHGMIEWSARGARNYGEAYG